MKLMAIFLQGRGSKTWKIGEEGLRFKFLEPSGGAAAVKVGRGLWNSKMEKEYWRRKYL